MYIELTLDNVILITPLEIISLRASQPLLYVLRT